MKTGLVLAGGGAKGSFQAEVVRILERRGYEWDAIAGVSTGALNGSIIAQKETEKLKKTWDRTRRDDVWETGPLKYAKVALGIDNGLYDPEPLLGILRDTFDPNDVEIPFRSGTVDLSNGEYVPYEISPDESYDYPDKARKYVLASSAIPVFVEPVEISEDRQQMVDGGVRNITPLKDVMEMGDLDRIVVVVNSILDKNSVEVRANNVVDVVGSTINTLLSEIVREDVSQALKINEITRRCEVPDMEPYDIEIIEPYKSLGSNRNFSLRALTKRRKIARKTMDEFSD